jgi:putative membrane protein
MITGYSDHAANERTFLAWVRTGVDEGLLLILGGVALVVLATTRFVRITRLLDDAQVHSASNVRTELTLSAVLVLVVASYSLYLAFS